MKKWCFVVGTRPEIIKTAPIVKAAIRSSIPFSLVHTGQHYSPELSDIFFHDLSLPVPEHNISVGSCGHFEQVDRIATGLGRIFDDEPPAFVIAQGDTNSVAGAAFASLSRSIPFVHVEAGLRSRDYRMPEETNRIVADHIGRWLFPATSENAATLLAEGVPDAHIFHVGNTIADAILDAAPRMARSAIHASLGIVPGRYVLATAHRAENTDNEGWLRLFISSLIAIGSRFSLPVIYPMHPRVRPRAFFSHEKGPALRIIPPLPFFDFLAMEAAAACVITDSGGVQEEACIFGVPCITVRRSTERPETVAIGANRLTGVSSEELMSAVAAALDSRRGWEHPFGSGNAGASIVSILSERTQ